MILAMFTLLMAQLQGFKKAALVFVISPLGIIGVVMSLALFHAPFGFVALLGVISLAGMDMRNSIILIDQIEHDIGEGKSRWEAVIEATVRRSRPVVLTAASAISGDDPADPQRVLGAHGDRDHGRSFGSDVPHAPELAGALRALVPREAR